MSPHALMAGTMAAMGQVYAAKRILGWLLRGKLERTVFGTYARSQVRRWLKENRALLRSASQAGGGNPFEPGLSQKLRAKTPRLNSRLAEPAQTRRAEKSTASERTSTP
jgi:hypothetical protein